MTTAPGVSSLPGVVGTTMGAGESMEGETRTATSRTERQTEGPEQSMNTHLFEVLLRGSDGL